MNIPVVSATGNSFTGQQGEGFSAIVAGVISVTATNTSGDQLLPDAQRLGPVTGMGTMTDLAAPGEGMVAPTGDSGYSSVEGTSFATPLVTGAVVLLQQIYQARFGTLPTVNKVTQWLEQGSDPIYDPVTGLTIGRLDIPKAASLIPSVTSSPAPPAASAHVTVSIPALQTTPGFTSTVTATPVSYVPASSTAPSPPSTPAPSPPSTPSTGPAVVSQAAPAPANSGLSPNVQVFVNGQQVNSLNASQSNMLPSLPQNNFAALLAAMSAWAEGTGSGQATATSVSRVRIWSAASQASDLAPAGLVYPMGSLAVKMATPRRPVRR